MNNRGEFGIGSFLVLFIGIVFVTAILTGGIYSNIGTLTNKVVVPVTTQVTFPTNTTALTLNGQAVESVLVYNGTSGALVESGNYTVNSRVLSNGALTSNIIAVGPSGYQSRSVNISYTYEPFGYATDAGTRAVVSLIAIFSSLALIAFALWKVYDSGAFDFG